MTEWCRSKGVGHRNRMQRVAFDPEADTVAIPIAVESVTQTSYTVCALSMSRTRAIKVPSLRELLTYHTPMWNPPSSSQVLYRLGWVLRWSVTIEHVAPTRH
jgi:hypothetical protein